jgi:SM-20-related protein
MVDQIIQEIERHGYAHREGLLTSLELASIHQFFKTHESEFKPALVGSDKNKKRVEAIRGDFTYWLDPLDPPAVFEAVFKHLEKIKSELNQKLFLGMKDFECHLARYPAGSFYKKHLDRFENNSSRVLSFVFYLNEEWNDNDGGELVLFDKQDHEILRVLPAPGSFICFLSDEFPHEVLVSKRERRSLTGWMHTKNLN